MEIGAYTGKSLLYPLITLFKWQGVLVEPVPEHFEQLKKNFAGHEGLKFVNAAVSDTRGKLPFYCIDPEFIEKNTLPDWIRRISSLSREHLVEHEEYHAGVSQHIVETSVDVITLTDLLQSHPLPRIDVLQIDAERHDYAILKQLDFTKHRPSIINFEYRRLPQHEQDAAIQLFLQNDYFIKYARLKILAIHSTLFRTT